uniref:Uncharacterized protein n=1 Tax=Rhizophagus irregularis (strain DAOM 181602 / DAOM 197198 / MUCL 43194) TaxID=747089 RepID=U9ULL3_RHIID
MNFLDKFTTQQRNLYISAFKYFTTTDASNWSLKNYTTYVRGIAKQYHCSKKVLLEFYQFSLSECLLKSLIDQTTFNIKHVELVNILQWYIVCTCGLLQQYTVGAYVGTLWHVYTVGTCGCFVAPCGSIQLSHMVALAHLAMHNNQNSDCTNAKNSDNFNLFDITDDEISSYPWKINNSDMHERVKKCLRDIDITNINYDEPIRSSIIDTDNPPTWIKNEFSDDEWKVISSNDNCHYKKFIRRSERFFSNSEGSAIKITLNG